LGDRVGQLRRAPAAAGKPQIGGMLRRRPVTRVVSGLPVGVRRAARRRRRGERQDGEQVRAIGGEQKSRIARGAARISGASTVVTSGWSASR